MSKETLSDLLASPELPTPDEQADNLILFLGENIEQPGKYWEVDHRPEVAAEIGVADEKGLLFIRDHLLEEGLVSYPSTHNERGLTLTFRGWRRYGELRRRIVESKKAFMAMPFGDPELDHVYTSCFKVAVAKAGFTLSRLDEEPPAGLIDDRLRVEIRRSRFLVAELTNGNHGAYWEAGFAEGLGRPVFYTCNKKFYEEKGMHFDTNHMHTVFWDSGDFGDAELQLKSTIRATLPDEALMEDA